MTKPLPTHTTCPHCNHRQQISLWAYAHWDIPINVTCDKPLGGCGRIYGMQRGVSKIQRPKGV